MPRDRDEPIPASEELYRGLRVDWVDPDGRVLPDAIDSEGSSCIRQRYGDRERAKNAAAKRTGVAVTMVQSLPLPIRINGVEYETFAVDEPTDEEPAHCEVRVRRTSDRASRDNRMPGSKAAKATLRALLAGSFTVVETPT